MTLAEELKYARTKAIEETALMMAINIENKLREYAEKGERECFMNVPREYEGVCLNNDFIETIADLLDGVKVEIVERSTSALFPSLKRKDIRFSW